MRPLSGARTTLECRFPITFRGFRRGATVYPQARPPSRVKRRRFSSGRRASVERTERSAVSGTGNRIVMRCGLCHGFPSTHCFVAVACRNSSTQRARSSTTNRSSPRSDTTRIPLGMTQAVERGSSRATSASGTDQSSVWTLSLCGLNRSRSSVMMSHPPTPSATRR